MDVARVVKKLAKRAGLDASKYGVIPSGPDTLLAPLPGHRRGSTMAQTGPRSVQMLRRYIRDGNLFRENSAGKRGL
jgi:hypothetical protein